MKTFFSDVGVRIYHGDVLEILKQIPEESIDLIFADSPYNLSNDGFNLLMKNNMSFH